ncbi:MAG: FHA domain-containing protein [Chloroflexi bacterium]|nr:FHA domain-containing protein [Chloroflexota bacterium]
MITQNIAPGQDEVLPQGPSVPPRSYQPGGADAWGSLHLLDTGQVLPLTGRNEFTLGRISEGQPIMPDIDLSPYQAYASGVSRLHAVVKRDGGRIIIMDLGSANGTYINGKRVVTNVEQILNHGDIVALGKLKIQVLLKS